MSDWLDESRESEVEYFHMTAITHEDVGGLQVSMYKPFLVSSIECPSELNRERRRIAKGKRPAIQAFPQRHTLQQLGNDVRSLLKEAGIVYSKSIRMAQRYSGLSFQCELAQKLGIGSPGRSQNLHRDIPAEAMVHGGINFTHAASRKKGTYLIGIDPLTGLKEL